MDYVDTFSGDPLNPEVQQTTLCKTYISPVAVVLKLEAVLEVDAVLEPEVVLELEAVLGLQVPSLLPLVRIFASPASMPFAPAFQEDKLTCTSSNAELD